MRHIKNNLLVVKEGTESLRNGGQHLDPAIADDTASQIAELWESGIVTALVTSGAIAMGRSHCQSHWRDDRPFSKNALASIGAWPLLAYWGTAFLKHNLLIGQGWITYASLNNMLERWMFGKGIRELLSLRTVPVINENDLLADEEIRAFEKGFGDNDSLASRVAIHVQAGAILFLSDTDGFYTEDPKLYPEAKRYRSINAHHIPPHLMEPRLIEGTSRGGVQSKILSAAKCAKSGMYVGVSRQYVGKQTIVRFLNGETTGTFVKARGNTALA